MDCLIENIKLGIPVYYLKFEELRENPKICLNEVFSFLLEKKDLSGSVIEKRIQDVLDLGHSATQAYRMKSTDR